MIRYISAINASPRLSLQGLGKVEMLSNAEAFKNLLVESVRQLNAAQAQADQPIQPSAAAAVLARKE